MTYDAIIFDLDGTLLDTLQDIADAANQVLEANGWPTHPVDAYRYFVGGGVGNLMDSAIPAAARGETRTEDLISAFRKKYRQNWRDHTRPYDGVPELLDALGARNVKMAVLSNKPDSFTKLFVKELLSSWRFESVLGSRPGVPKKPDPTAALELAGSMATPPERILFAGDSGADMQTATNAAMYPVGVLWGFRTRDELEAGGAKRLVSRPGELVGLLG